MWFKNLTVYRLTQDIEFAAEALQSALASKPPVRAVRKSWSPSALSRLWARERRLRSFTRAVISS